MFNSQMNSDIPVAVNNFAETTIIPKTPTNINIDIVPNFDDFDLDYMPADVGISILDVSQLPIAAFNDFNG